MSQQTEAKLPLMQALEEMGMMPPYIREYRQRIATLEAELRKSSQHVRDMEVSQALVAGFLENSNRSRRELTAERDAYKSRCSDLMDVAERADRLEIAGNALAATLKRDGECSCLGDQTCDGCVDLAKWDAAKGKTS